MQGSIIDVFRACAAATGSVWAPPKRTVSSVVMCPLHKNKNTPALSISDSNGVWKCHAGCGGGGILDVPIAFGLAIDRTEASRWLAERALIPPTDTTRGTKNDRAFIPRVSYTKTALLDDDSRHFRTSALLDALDVIGPTALRSVRDYIATMRYRRELIDQEHLESTLASFRTYTTAHPNGYPWDKKVGTP